MGLGAAKDDFHPSLFGFKTRVGFEFLGSLTIDALTMVLDSAPFWRMVTQVDLRVFAESLRISRALWRKTAPLGCAQEVGSSTHCDVVDEGPFRRFSGLSSTRLRVRRGRRSCRHCDLTRPGVPTLTGNTTLQPDD